MGDVTSLYELYRDHMGRLTQQLPPCPHFRHLRMIGVQLLNICRFKHILVQFNTSGRALMQDSGLSCSMWLLRNLAHDYTILYTIQCIFLLELVPYL